MNIHPNVLLEDFAKKAAAEPRRLSSVPINTDVSLGKHTDIHIGEITYSKSI